MSELGLYAQEFNDADPASYLLLTPESVATPIDIFAHPDSNSLIDVVSTVHVGEPEYYVELASHLGNRINNNFNVFLEGISVEPTPQDKPIPIRWIESQILEAEIDSDLDLQLLFAKTGKFVTQSALASLLTNEENDWPDFAINVDTDTNERAKYLGFSHSFKVLYRKHVALKRLVAKQEKADDDGHQLMYDIIADHFKKSGKRKSKSIKDPNIRERDKGVMEALDARLEDDQDAKIAILWGASHSVGIVRGLKERGYLRVNRKVVTVARNPKTKPA